MAEFPAPHDDSISKQWGMGLQQQNKWLFLPSLAALSSPAASGTPRLHPKGGLFSGRIVTRGHSGA
jgi:hypothetical protein